MQNIETLYCQIRSKYERLISQTTNQKGNIHLVSIQSKSYAAGKPEFLCFLAKRSKLFDVTVRFFMKFSCFHSWLHPLRYFHVSRTCLSERGTRCICTLFSTRSDAFPYLHPRSIYTCLPRTAGVKRLLNVTTRWKQPG